MKLSVEQIVNKLLGSLSDRQREVIEKRYGMKDGNVLTLAELGKSFGVTRERIRQVEASALNDLKVFVKKGELNDFFTTATAHLKNFGGLRREALLVSDFKFLVTDPNASHLAHKVRFLMDLVEYPKYSPESEQFHSYWYVSSDDQKKATGFIVKLVKFLNTKRKEVVTHENIDKVFNEAIQPHNLKDLVALNYVSLSKQFHVNQYGDFGLSAWSEVNPRTVRDWAYLVLRKEKQPLHFINIANMINKFRKEKPANAQTVHNELIKDERFVLVGRGIYGLQEFGLMSGTAREVIGRLLKKNGSLKPKELLDLVVRERVFKKNTIFINLQNKKHFQRLSDGRYAVKEV